MVKQKIQKKNTQKNKDRTKRTLLKSGVELRCPGKVSSSYSPSDTRHVTVKQVYVKNTNTYVTLIKHDLPTKQRF